MNIVRLPAPCWVCGAKETVAKPDRIIAVGTPPKITCIECASVAWGLESYYDALGSELFEIPQALRLVKDIRRDIVATRDALRSRRAGKPLPPSLIVTFLIDKKKEGERAGKPRGRNNG